MATVKAQAGACVTFAALFGLLLPAILSGQTQYRYALLLTDSPAAAANPAPRVHPGPEVAVARALLGQKQAPLQAELRRRHFHITGSTQLLLNAIYVAAAPGRLAELRALPGVRRVVFLPPLRPALDHAEQLVNTSSAWSLLNGTSFAGLGIKVAVIDSGIDQTHPAFQDPELAVPPGYPICQPQDCAFTNNKIIVARSYVAQEAAGTPPDPAQDSRPDDYSPRDHQGHGTAVAMVIAGETNAGPGDIITGLAPKAFLGNYKIFGSPAVNDSASADAVIQALEDAVTDGMDIANLSLGGPALTGALDSGSACGEPAGTPCDPLSQAVENATSLGLLVVVAAGNDGGSGISYPALSSVESPSIAPSAISVSASTNSHAWLPIIGGFTPLDLSIYNTVASFTSRGPAPGTARIKPDMAAPGTAFFIATQNYDPGGDLYNMLRYTIASGTSFSAPMVAGAAALVRQINPTWQPWQIKSALVNTTTQDITEDGQPSAVTAVGAGKLNAGNALLTTVVANPATLSFSSAQAQAVQIQNLGATPATLQISTSGAPVTVDQSTLTIAPGEPATLKVSVPANPAPGSYQGFLIIQGGPTPLQIPYLYLVTDGFPANAVRLLGDADFGLAGASIPDGILAFQVTDRYGLPVPNLPVSFSITQGSGQILDPDAATNQYGIATARAVTGKTPGVTTFTAAVAGMTVNFNDSGVAQPSIAANGVVNAASYLAGSGIAPGSYISIFGSALALGSFNETTPNLPVSLVGTSVSFDVPGTNLGVPGHLISVSAEQVNVQAPWELQGQQSVEMKVSIRDASGGVFTVPVVGYSPGLFSPTAPAIRGQTYTLYGTGFGPVNHQPASGDPAPDASSTTLATPSITIAGIPAAVQFSGLAPGYAGLYQINITVPADAAPGNQPVVASVNGFLSNTVILQIQ